MWIKICGVNNLRTAAAIADLRPGAIGLNFCRQSPRYVAPDEARQIAETCSAQTDVIGVFVEPDASEIREQVTHCDLDGVQVHDVNHDDAFLRLDDLTGDRASAARASPISDPEIAVCRVPSPFLRIRAFQIGEEGLQPLAEYAERCRLARVSIDAYLVDAHAPGQHGGTGKRAPWDRLNREYRRDEWPPMILAGGLRPENVGEAISTVRPWGVDVASGVESSPGVKDLDQVARFVEEARRAFQKLEQDSHGRDAVR